MPPSVCAEDVGTFEAAKQLTKQSFALPTQQPSVVTSQAGQDA